MRSLIVAIVAFGSTVSCAIPAPTPEPPRGENCGASGQPWRVADCDYISSTHADCGGGGDPVFACEIGSDLDPTGCKWFANDCVPVNFVASVCPTVDVCCRGATPYEATLPVGPRGTRPFLTTYGTAPIPIDWNVTSSVSIDPLLAPVSTQTLTCAGRDCGTIQVGFRVLEGTFAIRSSVAGDDRHVFIVDIARIGDALGGRVCDVGLSYDDIGSSCPDDRTPRTVCATTGTIRISSDPFEAPPDAVLALDVMASFPGYSVEIRL